MFNFLTITELREFSCLTIADLLNLFLLNVIETEEIFKLEIIGILEFFISKKLSLVARNAKRIYLSSEIQKRIIFKVILLGNRVVNHSDNFLSVC